MYRCRAECCGVHGHLTDGNRGQEQDDGNSVRHSRSGDPGEMITVAVKVTGSAVRVEVTDLRELGVPELVRAGGDEVGGRGLQLVAGLATRWGGVGAANGRLHGSRFPYG